jgi:hypothetical protein
MEMTRRQFALSIAAASTFHSSSLLDPRFRQWVFPVALFPAELPGRMILRL